MDPQVLPRDCSSTCAIGKKYISKLMIAWASPGNGRPAILYRKMRLCSSKQFADLRRGQKSDPIQSKQNMYKVTTAH